MNIEHVKKVFYVVQHNQFFIKFCKCACGKQEVEYLGHLVTIHGVKVDQSKI